MDDSPRREARRNAKNSCTVEGWKWPNRVGVELQGARSSTPTRVGPFRHPRGVEMAEPSRGGASGHLFKDIGHEERGGLILRKGPAEPAEPDLLPQPESDGEAHRGASRRGTRPVPS